jgi:hypothetical protein
MTGYLFHPTDGRWLLWTEDGRRYQGKTRAAVLRHVPHLTKVVRYEGRHSPAEMAMTVVDLEREGKVKAT